MTRSELITAIAERFPGLTRQDVNVSVGEILEAVGRQLAGGGRIEIRGFGSFMLRHHPARMRRNPKTGAPVPVRGKHVPAFRAAKELRERVDP